MESLLLVISFIFTAFSLSNKRYRKSMLSIFCVIWFSIFFLYSFRLFGFYDCKESTFSMYLIGFTAFVLGSLVVGTSKMPNSSPYIYSVDSKATKYRIVLLKMLSIISIFVFTKKSILAIPFWISGGAGEVKSAIIMDDALNAGSIEEILYTFVCRPIQIIMVIYSVIVIMAKMKERSIIIYAVLLTISGYICSGSKAAVIELVIMTFAYILLYTNQSIKNIIRQYKTLLLFIIVICLFIVLLLSMKDEGFATSAYAYLCGCMPCSDYHLNNTIGDNYFFGLFSFNGFFRALNLIPRYLGIGPDSKVLLDIVWAEIIRFENTMYIADNFRYNAFVSMFTFFYADGGLYGVFIFSFLFGLSCSLALKHSYKDLNIFSCSLVLFLVLFIFHSMVRFQLSYAPNAMALIYIFILLPRKTIR